MIRILVTGFGAFPGARRNPSAELAALLERDQARRLARLGIDLSVGMLPVVFGEVAMALEGLAARDAPDAILHLGLASRAKRIAVEAVARNRIATLHPDAMRRTATERRVLASGEIGRAHV